MTVDPFHVDPVGLRNLAQSHADVAAALDDSMSVSADEIAGFEQRYGRIAAPAERAVTEIMAARIEVLTGLSGTSADLSDRLSSAVHAYERSDESEAASVRSTGLHDLPTGSSGTPISAAPSESLTAASSASVSDALTAGQSSGTPTHGLGASVDRDEEVPRRSPARNYDR
jgi:hypothetical protein